MNYTKIYNDLITKAQLRSDLSIYTESHHIMPKCLGGSDEPSNLVELTPEEHYVAHQLLAKIYPTNSSLIYAAAMMCVGRTNNKIYGWIKKRFVEQCKAKVGSKNPAYGTKWICDPVNKINRKILAEEVIPEGWVKGRNAWNKRKKLSPEKLSDSKREGAMKRWKLHPKMPEYAKRKMSTAKIGNRSLSGRIWITNGKENRAILIDSEIPNGWKRGKTLRRHDEGVSYGSSKADS